MTRRHHQQSGMVSILVVMFFMIFMSLLIVGFVKIMSDEQRQATDNDLSASALAAAQSGVEDGKRILLHCASGADSGAPCNNALSSGVSQDCSVLTDNNSNNIRSQLGITMDTNKDIIVGDTTYQQRYNCLLIKKDTGNVELPLSEGRSEIIQLDVVGSSFDQLDLAWGTRDNPQSFNANNAIYTALPTNAGWTYGAPALPKPALLRVQFISYTTNPNSIDLDATERNSRTLFILPVASTVASGTASSSISADVRAISYDALRTGGVPIIYGSCTMNANQGYNCTKKLTGFTASGSLGYYMRVTPYYADTPAILTITPSNAGAPVLFSNVQPEIDVTGRANDVFRRVKARVQYAVPDLLIPEYALETAAPVCKNIIVADAANSQYCP